MNQTSNYRKDYMFLLYCMLIAGAFLAICSKCSFLYPINNWSDTNIYFTIGKSIMNGKVLYADIVDQKGPLIFFLFGLSYLISNTSLFGVYLLEILCIGIFLFFSGKCFLIYIDNRKILFFIIPIIAIGVLTSIAFGMGGSAEEICMPFLGYSMYSIARAISQERMLKFTEVVLNGICATCVLWIKFTILGFYFGLVIFVVIWYLRYRKGMDVFKVAGQFMLGFLIASLPIVVYFIVNGALDDFYQGYIYNNLFMYPGKMSIMSRILFIVRAIWFFIKVNVGFSVFMVLGLLWLIIKKKWEALCIILSFVMLSIGVYVGGKTWYYYALVFAVYTIWGIIPIVKCCKHLFENRIVINNKWLGSGLMIEICILLICSYYYSDNVELMKIEKEKLPQYRFANIMSQEENAQLISYNCMDGGFYLLNEIVPECKYYFEMNMELPEMSAMQDEFVIEGKSDYVITLNQELKEYDIDTSKYKFEDKAEFFFEGKNQIFYLYKKTEVQ